MMGTIRSKCDVITIGVDVVTIPMMLSISHDEDH